MGGSTRLAFGLLTLTLAATTSASTDAIEAEPAPDVVSAPCREAVAVLFASLPDAAMEVYTARPDDAWPTFDATTAAMVPDTVLGEPNRLGYLRGGDPMRRREATVSGSPTLAGRLGLPDSAQHGVSNLDPAYVESVFADPWVRLSIAATRIDGVTGAELLPYVLVQRLAAFSDVTCEVTRFGGLPVLQATSGTERFAFMGYRDAWLAIDTVDESLQGTLYGQREPWEPARFDAAVSEVATAIAALPPDPAPVPLTAPASGTRITPPAASIELAEHLAAMFGVYVPESRDRVGPPARSGLVGADPGMLGEGMVPGSILVATVPSLQSVAVGLGVDPMTLWGDVASAFDVGYNGPFAELVAHIDPDGQGERWIEPLAAAYRARTILLHDVERGDRGPEGWAPRDSAPVDEMDIDSQNFRGVIEERDGVKRVTAFWATGPFVFQLHADSEETIEGLLWALTSR